MLIHSGVFVPLVALCLLTRSYAERTNSETGIWQTSQRVNSIPVAAHQGGRIGRSEKDTVGEFLTDCPAKCIVSPSLPTASAWQAEAESVSNRQIIFNMYFLVHTGSTQVKAFSCLVGKWFNFQFRKNIKQTRYDFIAAADIPASMSISVKSLQNVFFFIVQFLILNIFTCNIS